MINLKLLQLSQQFHLLTETRIAQMVMPPTPEAIAVVTVTGMGGEGAGIRPRRERER